MTTCLLEAVVRFVFAVEPQRCQVVRWAAGQTVLKLFCWQVQSWCRPSLEVTFGKVARSELTAWNYSTLLL